MAASVKRLFEQFQPSRYGLALDIDEQAMTFRGTVMIKGKKVGRPSQRLTFHQKDLKITAARVTKHDKKGDQEFEIARINKQNSLNEVRLHCEAMFYPGEYTIVLDFTGDITRPMNGIYPCFFTHNGEDKKLFATQFESHYARQAFPCIDEPEAKALFDLTIVTPTSNSQTVLGNTPISRQEVIGNKTATSFETTPLMSPYLLAFVYGELSCKEGVTKSGTVIRSYATPGNAALTGFSVEVASKCLEFFEEYYGIPYPLTKLDMVALPDFSAGAMENWGLVTFRESVLLVDEQSTSIETKQLMAMVVAHELSHQWFGNLVTMRWWNDLWLNESFANMMEYLAVDALYPEWQIWEHFVSSEMASAKRRDSLADVQPIKTDVHHPDEINSIFDPSIVYAKGGSVLRMLMNYIGADAFREGLRKYFKKHAYSNTVAADLWATLGEASGKDITSFMADWLNRPGYPLVTVAWKPASSQLQISQRRFLSDPNLNASKDSPWQVPLAATFPLDNDLLTSAEASIAVTEDKNQPLLFNHDGQSYYLPLYKTSEHFEQIVKAITGNTVDVIDRLLLLDNYTMLQRGGECATTDLLELLQAYEHETAESVWGAIAVAVAETRKLIEGDETSEAALNTMIAKLVMSTVTRIGWDDGPDDSAQTLRLRGLAIAMAAGAKVPAVLTEGKKRFAAFKKPSDLPATIRSAVYFIGARHGTAADSKKLLKLHNAIHNADEKEELAAGLTATKDPKNHDQLLALLTTDAVRRQDLMHWFVWLLRNRYARAATWSWLTSHWEWLEKEFSSDKGYSLTARYSGSIFSTEAELAQFKAFFGPKAAVIALSRDIALGEQEIVSKVAWRNRNQASVTTWLAKQ